MTTLTRKPNSTNPYPKALREKLVRLAQEGAKVQELADKHEPSAASIRAWVHEAEGKPPAWERRKRDRSRQVTTLTLPLEDKDVPTLLLDDLKAVREERDYLKHVILWLVLKMAPQ